MRSLGEFIHVIHVSKNSVATKFNGEPIFKSKESSLDDDGVGGLSITPHLLNPLIPFKISLIVESCVTFVVHPNFKYGATKP
jgi:hypothetical protein